MLPMKKQRLNGLPKSNGRGLKPRRPTPTIWAPTYCFSNLSLPSSLVKIQNLIQWGQGVENLHSNKLQGDTNAFDSWTQF